MNRNAVEIWLSTDMRGDGNGISLLFLVSLHQKTNENDEVLKEVHSLRHTKQPGEVSDIAILLLVAGNSSRLGQPKQLLGFKGKNLLAHTLGEAMASRASQVAVVLCAYPETILPTLPKSGYHQPPILNPYWEKGMGNS